MQLMQEKNKVNFASQSKWNVNQAEWIVWKEMQLEGRVVDEKVNFSKFVWAKLQFTVVARDGAQ